MLGTRTLRERSASKDPEGSQQSQVKSGAKDKTKEKLVSDQWVEPPVSSAASYKDNNGSHYGVSEYMQPLGEAPNARVKARVKADGARKSMIGKNSTAVGSDVEGTPQPPSRPHGEASTLPQIKVEDENDGDYAPKVIERKKTRPRAAKRYSDAPVSHPPKPAPQKPQKPAMDINKNKRYDAEKLKNVVDAAKRRAIDVGMYLMHLPSLRHNHNTLVRSETYGLRADVCRET